MCCRSEKSSGLQINAFRIENCFNAITNLLWDVWLITMGLLSSSPDVNWENYLFSSPSASRGLETDVHDCCQGLKFCQATVDQCSSSFLYPKKDNKAKKLLGIERSDLFFSSIMSISQNTGRSISSHRALENDKIMSVFWWLKVSVDQSVPLFWFSVHCLCMV